MSFGVNNTESDQEKKPKRRIVKAVTRETIVALVVLFGIFAAFTMKMGVAFTFKRPWERLTISS